MYQEVTYTFVVFFVRFL